LTSKESIWSLRFTQTSKGPALSTQSKGLLKRHFFSCWSQLTSWWRATLWGRTRSGRLSTTRALLRLA
jgi:hypothetical protein